MIVSAAVGAGHDGAGRELARRLEARGVKTLVVDFFDFTAPGLGRIVAKAYSESASRAPWMLERSYRGGTVRTEGLPLGTEQVVWIASKRLAKSLRHTDLVISTYPYATRAIGRLKAEGVITAATVNYITDPAPHAGWLHDTVDVNLSVSEATAAVARARFGALVTPAGPLVRPDFTRMPSAEARMAQREKLRVDPHVTLVLVACGSDGIGSVVETARALLAGPDHIVPVVLCGTNVRLQQRLSAMGVRALGWTRNIAELMWSADVLVHNAGGMVFTESLVVGLPAVTYNAIAGHGHANARVLEQFAMSAWPRSPAALCQAVTAAGAKERSPLRVHEAQVVEHILPLLPTAV